MPLNTNASILHVRSSVRRGKLSIEETEFEELKAVFEEEELFKSPRGICRMGYNQPFKIVSVQRRECCGMIRRGSVEVDAYRSDSDT